MDNLVNQDDLAKDVAPLTGVVAAWRRIYRRHRSAILGGVTMALFLVIWELAPALGLVKPLFTSSPSRIVIAAQWLFANGFWYDIWVSFSEFALGFSLALVLGIGIGVVLGWFPTPRAMFEPFIISLYSVPRVALLPLIILWLGIGIESKVALVFLGAVFPIIVNSMSGVRSADETLVRCARAFGANERQVLWTVALPGSIPFIVSGMRLGVGRGLVGVIVGEMVASQAGIGFMMSRAGATFQTDKVFVGVVILALFGWGVTALLEALERRFERWRPQR